MNDKAKLNWLILAIGVGLAAVFATGWLWAAGGDRVTSYRVLPAGEKLTIADTTWQLESLRVDTVSESRYGDIAQPPSGAVFVFATIGFDAAALTPEAEFSCRFDISDADELSWQADLGYLPGPDGVESYCEPGKAGTVKVRYTVPARLLDSIVGVTAAFYLDGETLTQEPLVMAGPLSR